MIDHTYYINLKHSTDRRGRIEHEIRKAKLSATRIDAVYGPALKKEDITPWTTKTCGQYCNRRLIGCALSHIKTWKTFLQSEHQTALILEDDAIINSTDLEKDLKALSVPSDYDVIVLGSCINLDKTILSLFVLGRIQRQDVVKKGIIQPGFILGTHGYMINRKAAERMVQYFEQNKIYMHVDLQLNVVCDKENLKMYTLDPPLITQRTNLQESMISQYQFPMSINYLLDKIENKDHQTLGYQMNVSFYETAPNIPAVSLQLNAWLLVFLVLGLIIKKFNINVNRVAMVYAAVFIIEYALTRSHKMIVPATVYYLLLVSPSLLCR